VSFGKGEGEGDDGMMPPLTMSRPLPESGWVAAGWDAGARWRLRRRRRRIVRLLAAAAGIRAGDSVLHGRSILLRLGRVADSSYRVAICGNDFLFVSGIVAEWSSTNSNIRTIWSNIFFYYCEPLDRWLSWDLITNMTVINFNRHDYVSLCLSKTWSYWNLKIFKVNRLKFRRFWLTNSGCDQKFCTNYWVFIKRFFYSPEIRHAIILKTDLVIDNTQFPNKNYVFLSTLRDYIINKLSIFFWGTNWTALFIESKGLYNRVL